MKEVLVTILYRDKVEMRGHNLSLDHFLENFVEENKLYLGGSGGNHGVDGVISSEDRNLDFTDIGRLSDFLADSGNVSSLSFVFLNSKWKKTKLKGKIKFD